MSQYTIRWVLTHDPIALFEEAARAFVERVHALSDGALVVEVATPREYGDGARVPAAEVMRRVASGQLEMCQTYTTVLGAMHEPLWALDLPFLFESHEHAARVLDGDLGRGLLEGLAPHGLRGLAFTYSGGYRLISTLDRELHTLEDIAHLRVRTSFNPVVADLFSRLGASPHAAPLQAIPRLTERGLIDAAESTWPRYWDMGHAALQPVVNETAHSLFLTSIVVGEAFYQRLPAGLRDVLHVAALEVAQQERAKSIADADAARAACVARGGRVVTMSAPERARFARFARPVHERFAPRFGQALVDRIRAEAAAAVAA